jgi:hypothetical protein
VTEKEHQPWLEEPIPKQERDGSSEGLLTTPEGFTPMPELAEMEIVSEPPTEEGESVDEEKIDVDSTDKIGDSAGAYAR